MADKTDTGKALDDHKDECGKRYDELWKEIHNFKLDYTERTTEMKNQLGNNTRVTWVILVIILGSALKYFIG